MRHLADQPAYRVARQPRIGIERHDVADARRSQGQLLADPDETGIGGATQQAVQFMKLAALALPADPARFTRVPDAPAMKQQKARATRRRAVACIQALDTCRCRHRRGLGRRACSAAASVQSESSAKCRSPSGTREVMNFQALDLGFDGIRRGQQHGHRDQRAQF